MRIVSNCSKLPFGFLWQIKICLQWICPSDLVGLDHIELKDNSDDLNLPSFKSFNNVTEEENTFLGLYIYKYGKQNPYIVLFVNTLYRGIPSIYWLTPVVTIRIMSTLAHEIGHHCIAQRGYIYQPDEKFKYKEIEEEFADRYAYDVIKRMREKWYYRFGSWGLKDLAGWYIAHGHASWKYKDYKEAAEYWNKAWFLDPSREDVAQWYGEAKKMCSNEKE